MRVYLDVCCLFRAMDDQEQVRIFWEADAVALILRRIQHGQLELITSDAVEYEVSQTSDHERRRVARGILPMARSVVSTNAQILSRAAELVEEGIEEMDAIHLACAEHAQCDVLLTTDDALVRRWNGLRSRSQLAVMNPVRWVAEEF